MSSRALRRLQREQEEERQRQQQTDSEDEDEPQRPPKKSAFDILNAVDDDGEEKHENESDGHGEGDSDERRDEALEATPAPRKSGKKKKKSKKKRGKATPGEDVSAAHGSNHGLDEIDLALKSLKSSDKSRKPRSGGEVPDAELQKFYSQLSISRNNLNALNEMKKLFGNAVLVDDNDEPAQRRARGPQHLNLVQILSAEFSPVSRRQGLSGLSLRQNVFMAGKTTWPKASSGGLGMELVEKFDDFTIEYRFVHNAEYQRVQGKFEAAASTLQADNIIGMTVQHPYHVASLLQTAEIAKHQGDHSLAGDLYERALYNFGRSVQSTFGTALAEGKARMDFRRPENREFWLTAWRYIGALSQRGTFKTAFEWAKLLLSLDPEGDPYCVHLIIDQLALRGGQAGQLVELASTRMSTVDWGQESPNIRISLGLAHYRLKELEEAKDTLLVAVKDFPWIFARLFQQLDIDKAPPAIWGSQPRTDLEKFQTESYAVRAKDLWNTPETLSFLRQTVESATRSDPPPPDKTKHIELNDARHVIVSEMPTLIATLPREFTTMQTTSSDPLPPLDSLDSYNHSSAQEIDEDLSEDELQRVAESASTAGGGGITGWLGAAMARLMGGARAAPGQVGVTRGELNAAVEALEDGPQQNLGQELGLEEVTVHTLDEYEAALQRGQYPILADGAQEAVLRRLRQTADSQTTEDESQNAQDTQAAARRQQQIQAQPMQATVEDDTEDEAATSASQRQVEEFEPVYDEDANKRFLAGRGMLAVKDFVTAHGTDERSWTNLGPDALTPVAEYVRQVGKLQQRSNRSFILDYALKQGAGLDASNMIKRLLEQGWRS